MKKFRAWDQFNEGFHYSHNYTNLSSFFLEIEKLEEAGNAITLEVYTDLEDNKGVDIYSGDIVKEKWFGRDEIEAVEYIAPGFDPFMYNGGGEMSAESCEVIGNIHQNPELLK